MLHISYHKLFKYSELFTHSFHDFFFIYLEDHYSSELDVSTGMHKQYNGLKEYVYIVCYFKRDAQTV